MLTRLFTLAQVAPPGGGDPFKSTVDANQKSTVEQSAIWGALKGILFLLGVLLAVMGVVKFLGKISSAKLGEGAKILAGTILGCAFLFNPEWVFGIIGIAGKAMGALLSSVDDVTPDTGNTPAPATN